MSAAETLPLEIQIRLTKISIPHPVENSLPSLRCPHFLTAVTFLWSPLVLELVTFTKAFNLLVHVTPPLT